MSDWRFDPKLREWGATFTPAKVTPGQFYWRLISADGPMDIGDNHHIYIDLVDGNLQRMVNVRVQMWWEDDDEFFLSEAKPGEPAALSIPLYAGGNAYGIRVADGQPSDELFGLGLGYFVPHHSFRLIFQLTNVVDDDTPVTPPSMTLEEALDNVQFYLDIAKRLA